MANTLTNLIGTLYASLDVVSRELVGFIPAVRRDTGVERAAKGQKVIAFQTPPVTAADITPAVTPPDTGDQTIGSVSLEITKVRRATIRWNGEEERALMMSGARLEDIRRDQFANAMRTLVNEIEVDIATKVKQKASRAYGTATTTPFGTAGDYTDAAMVRKILVDNGAPTSDLQLVLSTAAAANLRGKQGGRGVDAEGSPSLLRQGVLLDIHGFEVRESAAATQHTKGSGTGYLVNDGTGLAVGDTEVTVDTGTGTILAGDIATFAADTVNKYVVGSALDAGVFKLNKPGVRVSIPDNNAISVGASYTHNAAFSRSAVVLATRLPARPRDGDMADDVIVITDPVSGLSFEVALYRQYHQISYEVGIAWGVEVVKEEHVATLLG